MVVLGILLIFTLFLLCFTAAVLVNLCVPSADERVMHIIRILVAITKCDGEIDEAEISAINSYFNSNPLFGEHIISDFKEELKHTNVKFLGYDYKIPLFVLERKNNTGDIIRYNISDLSSAILSKIIKKYSERMDFMDSLFQIAYSQDGVSDVEVDLLREVAHYLCIKSWDFTGFLYKYEYLMDEQQKKQKKQEEEQKRTENGSGAGENERHKSHKTRFKNVTSTRTKEALQLLEITENADEQEIKSAYRRMAKKYHPDTLSANVSEKEKEEAVARFRSINEAYEFLLSLEKCVKS